MPIDYSKYPVNWKTEIVPRIRERSGNRCERCLLINHSWIIRFPIGHPRRDLGYMYVTGPEDIEFGIKPTRIILTTAHIGPNKHDKMNAADDELLHLCQGCHLMEDLQDHIRHRRENREAKLGILRMELS
jgi:hypothetical protein